MEEINIQNLDDICYGSEQYFPEDDDFCDSETNTYIKELQANSGIEINQPNDVKMHLRVTKKADCFS